MHLLTFDYATDLANGLRPVLREVAASPTPVVAGLLMRYWGIDERKIRGRYLFADQSTCTRFAGKPDVDPAFAQISRYVSASSTQRTILDEEESLPVIENPLFVIAAPRSGSTLLFDLLAQSADLWTLGGESEGVIEGIPKLHPANRGFTSHRLTDIDADPATKTILHAAFLSDLRDRNNQRYLALPKRERPRRIKLLEKTPENCLRIPFLETAFASARFVFLHRDGRQSVSSLLEGWRHEGFVKIPHLPGWPLGRWHFLLPDGWRKMRNASLLEVAAFQWAEANRQALDDLETIPRERWLSVDYNELVATPQRVLRQICNFAEIEVDDQLRTALTRPLPVSATTITPPSPIKWRSNPEFNQDLLRPYIPVMARLRDLDQHAPPPRLQPAGPVRFSCFLEDLPDSAESTSRENDLYVNPSFHFQVGSTIPLSLLRRTRFRDRFLPNHPLLWIEDSVTRVYYPFWVPLRQIYLFRQFVAGRRPPPMDADLRARLVHAGILVTTDSLQARCDQIEEKISEACISFANERYCELPAFLHAAHVMALRRYYLDLIRSGWEIGDVQVRQRYGQHNEMMARYFHHQFTDFISRIAGEPVKPSYTYVSAYQEGSILGAHVDRKQCEFTLSLSVEDGDSAGGLWPLWFQLAKGKVAVTQRPGDGVLFRGCDLPHWREQSASDHTSTVLLFHYVPESFGEVLH